MSGITPELLDALVSPDGGLRSQAETVYQSMSVNERVEGLLAQLSNNSDERLQLLTAVLLRRDICKLSDANLLKQLAPPLLQSTASCRLQVGHCLTELCATLSLVGDVTEVMPGILSSLQSPIQQGDVASLKFLANLADRSPVAFAQMAVPSLPSLLPKTMPTGAVVEAWTEVAVNAAIATTIQQTSLVRKAPELDDLLVDGHSMAASLGISLLPTILTWISNSNDEDAVQASLDHLSHAAVNAPSLLVAVLDPLVATCLELAKQTSHGCIKLASLQVLASLVSVGDVKRRILPANVASSIATTALPICAQLIAEGVDDDIEEWAVEPASLVEHGMEEDEDQAMFADSLVESFLQHLGAPALTVVLPLVQRLLESEDWRHARAGLAVLESGLAATPVSLAPHLPVVVQAACSLASSENARVQWQAVRLLGALCEVPTNIRDSPVVLERLTVALASPCSKVAAMASMGLVSYCRGDEDLDASKCLTPFLNDVLGALVRGPLSLTGTDTGSVTVRVRGINATAVLAEAASEDFGQFYSSIMPGLLASAQLPVAEIAGAAVEAATIIGQAVGKDLFQADAQQLLSWILPVLQAETSSFPLDQLLSACARIASVLGEEFAPYVDMVLPHLLRRAQAPPDVSIMVRICTKSRVGIYAFDVNLILFLIFIRRGTNPVWTLPSDKTWKMMMVPKA